MRDVDEPAGMHQAAGDHHSVLGTSRCLCCRFRRLYPDSALHVEAERLEATQASLFGVFGAQALLLAFSLKLKMSAALRQTDKGTRQGKWLWQAPFLRMGTM